MHVTTRITCRLCGSPSLTPVIDLGHQYLSNLFVTGDLDPPKRRVPLQMVRCNPALVERACGLVQLRHTVQPEVLFDTYWYQSGVNRSMREALQDIAHKAESLVHLKPGDVVLDIGCNDGTLLHQYTSPGIRKVGVDPVKNFASEATRDGITLIEDFFTARTYHQRVREKAKIVTTIAVLYDLDDPRKFVEDVHAVLDSRGIWIVQMSYLPLMLAQTAFDNICHEHLCYYSLTTTRKLLTPLGLEVFDVEVNDVNGGSFRLYIKHTRCPERETTPRVNDLMRYEFALALETDTPYLQFLRQALQVKRRLGAMLQDILNRGKRVFVYGASTKGNVLLQYCGLSAKQIPYAADRNPRKWGASTLGTNIQIISEEEARKKQPDYLLVLPWHFLPEILDREAEYLEKGGTLIVPLPKPVKITKKNARECRNLVRAGLQIFDNNETFRTISNAPVPSSS